MLLVPWEWRTLKIVGTGDILVVIRKFNNKNEIVFNGHRFETVDEANKFVEKESSKNNFYMAEDFLMEMVNALPEFKKRKQK